MEEEKKRYFPGLDGLRFIAATMVIITHIEQFKSIKGIPNFMGRLPPLGPLGVTLFFVLSGYLITHLLLNEKKKYNDINIKTFYLRRILRIWPLYFLIVFLAFFVIPHLPSLSLPHFSEHFLLSFKELLFLFCVFLPNIVLINFGMVPYASQLWTIGIEEQFYLLWPWLIKLISFRKLFVCLLLILGMFMFTPIFFHLYPSNHYLKELSKYYPVLRMDNLIIGAIAAYLVYLDKQYILQIIYNRYFQLSVYLLLLTCFFYSFAPTIKLARELPMSMYTVLFALLIANISQNKNSLLKLEQRSLKFLGKISYGLYIFHPLCIGISLYLTKNLISHTTIFNLTLYFLVFIFSIATATLSYYTFEKYFLNKKKTHNVRFASNINLAQ